MKPIAPLATAMLMAACTGAMPELRPLPTQTTPAISPFDDTYQAGKTHLMADRVGLALVMFQRALAIDPLSVAALNAAGIAYDELHRPDIAEQYYAKALAIEPNSADTLNNIAISLQVAGRPAEARDFIEKAAKLDAGNETIRANLARLDDSSSAEARGAAPTRQVARLPTDEADGTRPYLERRGLSQFELHLPTDISDRFSGAADDDRPLAAPIVKVDAVPLTAPSGMTKSRDEALWQQFKQWWKEGGSKVVRATADQATRPTRAAVKES